MKTPKLADDEIDRLVSITLSLDLRARLRPDRVEHLTKILRGVTAVAIKNQLRLADVPVKKKRDRDLSNFSAVWDDPSLMLPYAKRLLAGTAGLATDLSPEFGISWGRVAEAMARFVLVYSPPPLWYPEEKCAEPGTIFRHYYKWFSNQKDGILLWHSGSRVGSTQRMRELEEHVRRAVKAAEAGIRPDLGRLAIDTKIGSFAEYR